MSTNESATSVVKDLSGQLGSDRVLVSGPAYDKAREIWNFAVTAEPALIARPETPAEVQAAVRSAQDHGLPLSVRSGGYDWAGRALRPDGLVIDLSLMRDVTIDAGARVATVAGGANARDVTSAAAPFGLAAVTGACIGAVGMAGLTLGGGYGPLCGRAGLALDNLLGADVVLADGRWVTTDAEHEPELFWALRGGGGNFGVVTSLRVRLHPLDRVLAGFIVFPWEQADSVLRGLNEVLATDTDQLTVQGGILSGPDGNPTALLSPTWSGDLAQGANVIAELERLGTPLMSQVAPLTYGEVLGLQEPFIIPGSHYAIRTRTVAGYSPDVISALLETGAARTSPMSAILLHHFHGAAARVPLDSTAFGIRRHHLMTEIIASWAPDDADAQRHVAWADSVSAALAPHALPGGYAGLLGSDADEQIAHAYGSHAARLRAAKARFDPDGIFAAIPLPPASGG
ncbi:FAD-binding oxidoreductase [Pseudonocardia xinjiangensis]|uniref:FAD-binding oxidoreductase n=1 Tax=Pseudonocardia xinjiangensis TaxID=75289 RepID=UPI003D8FF742